MRGKDFELYRKYILLGCSVKAMSAKELSDNYGIPIGHCYNVIRSLLAEGTLRCTLTCPSEMSTVPLFITNTEHTIAFMSKA